MSINKAKLRREILSILLIAAIVMLGFDRAASYMHVPDPDSVKISIYTNARCSFCKRLRNYLNDNGIPYTDYDVEDTLTGALGFWALKGKGVPISVIGPEIIYGFDLEKIEATLVNLGYNIKTERSENQKPDI